MKDAIKSFLRGGGYEEDNAEARMIVELNIDQTPLMSAPPHLMGTQDEARQEK
jgi:hypothetical protein